MHPAEVMVSGSGRSGHGRLMAVLLVVCILSTVAVWRLVAGAGDGPGGGPEYFGRTTPPAKDVFRYTNGPEPETIDPGLMSGQPDGRIARSIFEGLFVPHPETLEPIEGMARGYELAADGVTYTFHLRSDAVWTNGDRVTAHDFEWSWMRVLHPDTPARYADLFYVIRNARAYKARKIADPALVGIQALDDSTFQVVLQTPTPYFLQLLTFYPFLPVHPATVQEHGDRWTHAENIVTNGPFRLAEHRQNDRIIMDKFHGYWDAENVRLDRIVAYSLDKLSTMLNMYRAGMIDWNPSGYLPAEYIPYVEHYKDYRAGPYLGIYFYSLVVSKPPLDDKRVRQALAYAIDRQRITAYVMHGSVAPWGNVVPQGFPKYSYPDGVRFDPQRARRLLAEAGYPNGEGFPPIEILFNTSEDHKKIAETIQAMWKDHLGIRVTLVNQEWASYLRATLDRNYQVARRSWIGDYVDPNTFLNILKTGDGNNRTNWGHPRYDELIDAAARERDPETRLRLLADAEAIALDELPYLPIYSYRTREFVAPYVRGLFPTALDTHPAKFIHFDRSGGDDRTALGSRGNARTTLDSGGIATASRGRREDARQAAASGEIPASGGATR